MPKLIDKFGREINYLRISVTDRCNLRCIYCMPQEGIEHKPQHEILSFEEIFRIAKVSVGLGIQKIRITGGEPLVRKGLPLLIERLKGIPGINEVGLTTNGVYLVNYAHYLRNVGLDMINVSLDTLIPERFKKITRGGDLKSVLDGIEAALSAGFCGLKINMVLLRGFNTDEVLDFAELASMRPVEVRFIEYMPTDISRSYLGNPFFSCKEAEDICGALGRLIPEADGLLGTSRVFRIEGFRGRVGFISPISRPFCSRCNKLRLTSDGFLRSCLHSSKSVNLKEAMEKGAQDEELSELIKEAAVLKPQSHRLNDRPIRLESENFSMCQIGG
ncbi:MAG: GTP 3',8-cyclase MoaA [Candidatus Omnitrophota bacterium]